MNMDNSLKSHENEEIMTMPEIVELDILDKGILEQLLQLQRVSYRREEELLGFPIPRIEDTPDDLLASGEVFIGMIQDGDLLGFLSLAADETVLDIHRLAVDPDYFRQGVGSDLIQFVFDAFDTVQSFMVTTGARNIPAIRLYEKMGFVRTGDFEPAPGVVMTRFEMNS